MRKQKKLMKVNYTSETDPKTNPKSKNTFAGSVSVFDVQFWNFGFWEIDVMQNRGYRPDPKPPSPARAGTSREGGPYVFGAVSPVPDVFAKFQMQCNLTGPRCLCQISNAMQSDRSPMSLPNFNCAASSVALARGFRRRKNSPEEVQLG